ncbi:MAG TPA: hypothetical protein DCZ76_09180 [Treponema sp.]|nr:hypothetical protein [Treponema sp.]
MVKKLHGCNFLTRALPIGAKLNLLPKKQKNPSTTQYSLAKETRSLSLSKGTFSKKTFVCKQERKNSMDFFRDCRIATQFCTLLPRHPWLDTVCQERKNPSLPQYRLAKETRSLHSQRSVKRPVEGNIPKKLFVHNQKKVSQKNHLSKKGFLGVKPLSRAGKGRGLRGGKTLASE